MNAIDGLKMSITIDHSYQSPNFNERRNNVTPSLLVMHYTACPKDEALKILTSRTQAVSAHYLVSQEEPSVYQLVADDKRAWHAGISFWRSIDDVNSSSIGLEIENWGYTYGSVALSSPPHPILTYGWSFLIQVQRRLGDILIDKSWRNWHPFPDEQIQRIIALSKQIIQKYGIDPENVVGHADVAPTRKIDPGPCFPWEKLAKDGVGAWYDLKTDRVHSNRPSGLSESWIQASLKEWGYSVSQTGHLDPETKSALQAFQMHFRPENYDGTIDEQSSQILDALLCQRYNKVTP